MKKSIETGTDISSRAGNERLMSAKIQLKTSFTHSYGHLKHIISYAHQEEQGWKTPSRKAARKAATRMDFPKSNGLTKGRP